MSKEEKLPNWDLTDYYPSIDSKEFKKDLSTFGAQSKKFEEKYKGKLSALPPKDFGKAIKDYEDLQTLGGNIGIYATLNKSTNLNNPKVLSFYQNTVEKLTEADVKTTFFSLEINEIPDKELEKKLQEPSVKKYKPFLDELRAFKQYQLTDKEEVLLQEKSVTGSQAWNKLYDKTQAKLVYTVDGKEYNDAELRSMMQDPNEEVRAKAGKEYGRVSKENAEFFADVTNVLAKDKQIEDDKRGFKKPVSSRNLSNQVEDEIVDTLVDTVKDNYANISHRYYKMKANWLGKDKLEYWDRNAPIPGIEEKKYSWEEAKDIVLESYNEFSPEMAKIGKKFFDNNWIDVAPKKGKESGAYAMPGTSKSHSYLLLNFQGKADDVMTLAHELGHGIHQELGKKQGDLQASPPLNFAETASIFGEMVTFKNMLKKEKDPKKRFGLVTSKAESMINTSVRQISFHDYETKVHDERKKGEISVEKFGDMWQGSLKESLGPAVKVDENSRYLSGQIPHLIHTPFYVYSYSFADSLVNSLYKVHEEGKVENFPKKFQKLLEKGGTEKHKEMLKPFGLDASKKDFWQKGLNVISELIDEAEKTSKELGLGKNNQSNKTAIIAKKKLANKGK